MEQPFAVTCYVLKHRCGHDASYHDNGQDFKTLLEIIEIERTNICPTCWERERQEVSVCNS